MLRILSELDAIEGDKRNAEVKAFTDTIDNIRKFAGHAEKTLDVMIRAEENWFWNSFLKIFR